LVGIREIDLGFAINREFSSENEILGSACLPIAGLNSGTIKEVFRKSFIINKIFRKPTKHTMITNVKALAALAIASSQAVKLEAATEIETAAQAQAQVQICAELETAADAYA
jgi:hypothetical protein